MKKLIKSLLLAAAALLSVTACDPELFSDEVGITDMIFYRHDATIMVGDTCYLQLYFEPEDITTPNAYWWVARGNVAMVGSEQGYVKGLQPGRDTVFVRTVDGQFDDKCAIEVLPRWEEMFDASIYQYDMVVVADVDILGHHNDPKIHVAAFLGNSLRGVGKVETSHGRSYTAFRIWHNQPSAGELTFRYYLPEECIAGDCGLTLPFDGELHGTLTDPVKITVTENPYD